MQALQIRELSASITPVLSLHFVKNLPAIRDLQGEYGDVSETLWQNEAKIVS